MTKCEALVHEYENDQKNFSEFLLAIDDNDIFTTVVNKLIRGDVHLFANLLEQEYSSFEITLSPLAELGINTLAKLPREYHEEKRYIYWTILSKHCAKRGSNALAKKLKWLLSTTRVGINKDEYKRLLEACSDDVLNFIDLTILTIFREETRGETMHDYWQKELFINKEECFEVSEMRNWQNLVPLMYLNKTVDPLKNIELFKFFGLYPPSEIADQEKIQPHLEQILIDTFTNLEDRLIEEELLKRISELNAHLPKDETGIPRAIFTNVLDHPQIHHIGERLKQYEVLNVKKITQKNLHVPQINVEE